jgi:non-specific serine/threonine protein kinase
MPAAVLDGRIYVLGGLVPGLGGTDTTATAEVYDPASDRWSAISDMPAPRHHLMAAVVGSHVYAIGGFDETGFNPVDTLWRYDPSVDRWEERAALPALVGAGAAAVIDGTIYLLGGVPGGTTAFAYDPEADTWEKVTDMSTAREHVAAVVRDGEIWVLGGRWQEAMHSSVEKFDPATGAWSAGPDMQEARSGFGAALVGDVIVVAGGEVFQPTRALTGVEALDDTWTSLQPTPTPIHGVPLAAVDGTVYLIGGSVQAAAANNTVAVWAYAPSA